MFCFNWRSSGATDSHFPHFASALTILTDLLWLCGFICSPCEEAWKHGSSSPCSCLAKLAELDEQSIKDSFLLPWPFFDIFCAQSPCATHRRSRKYIEPLRKKYFPCLQRFECRLLDFVRTVCGSSTAFRHSVKINAYISQKPFNSRDMFICTRGPIKKASKAIFRCE